MMSSFTNKKITTILLLILVMINNEAKATLSDKEFQEFIESKSGIQKLDLTVGYKPLGNFELQRLVKGVMDQVKDQPVYRSLTEQYIKISKKMTLQHGTACDAEFTNYKDKSGRITMHSLIQWYDFLEEKTSVQLCNFDQGLVCLQGKCQCKTGEIFKDDKCYRLPDYSCELIDWGGEPNEKQLWNFSIKILPTTLIRPEPPVPCIAGTVCKKSKWKSLSGPKCLCFDKTKSHCSEILANSNKDISKKNSETLKETSFHQVDLGGACNATEALEIDLFGFEVSSAYSMRRYSSIPDDQLLKQKSHKQSKDEDYTFVCRYEILETCEKRVCKRTTKLCKEIHGGIINPLHCENFMLTCDRPTCQISNGFPPIPPSDFFRSDIKIYHPFGECIDNAEDIVFWNPKGEDNFFPKSINICWCKDKKKYGQMCQMPTAYFGTLFNPSVFLRQNVFGFIQDPDDITDDTIERYYPLKTYQPKMNYWLQLLEKEMSLKIGDSCDAVINGEVKEITLDYFGSLPTLTKDDADRNKYKEFYINDTSKLDKLKSLVEKTETHKLCNTKMIQQCESNICTSKVPPGLVPVSDEEGEFAYAAGQKDCDKPQTSLPLIFGDVSNKCVPNAVCTKSCDPSESSSICLCDKGFEKMDQYCKKVDKPTTDICDSFNRQEIEKLKKKLAARQILKIHHYGCDVELEAMLQEIIYTDPIKLNKIKEGLQKILHQASISQLFCNPLNFLQCRKNYDPSLGFMDSVCLCFDGFSVDNLNRSCTISRGMTCGKSWKLPVFLNTSEVTISQPKCKSMRCLERDNGTFTCNPDPWSSAFKMFGKATSQIPRFLTVLSLLMFIMFAHNLAP